MDAAVVRLQLPASPAFIAAFDDAADKYASRRGFADGGASFIGIAEAAVRAVASASPSTISMVATELGDRVQLELSGASPAAPMDSTAAAAARSSAGDHDVTVDTTKASVIATVSLA